MKLLGEMHNSEYLEFAPEWPSSNNLLQYPKSHYYVNSSSKAHRDSLLQNSIACLEEASADGEHMDSASLSELFHGFQTIGDPEKGLFITDLATPKFSISVENMIKNETRTTEDQLKLVKEKLEKVLIAEKKGYDHNHTSGDKPLGGAANNENEAIANPLQHYVFISEGGLPETSIVKDHRTSLWELFQKTQIADKKLNLLVAETDKSSVCLNKKIMRRRMLHPPSQLSTTASVGTIDSASVDEKLQKILRMLQRFNPEASTISQKSQNLWKYVTKSTFTNKEGYRNRNQMLAEDIIIFPYRNDSEMSANHTKRNMSRSTFGGSDTSCNRECWIKSDSEYLILEL